MRARATPLVAIAVVLAGCSGRAATPAPRTVASPARSAAAARVLVVPTIPGPTPIAVMRRIMAQLGGGGVRDLRIGRAPTERGFAFRGSAWLHVRVPASGLARDYAQWVAQMAVHTYRDQARRRGFRMMDGLTMNAPGQRPMRYSMDFPPTRRRYPMPDAAAVVAGVRHRAGMLGLSVARTHLLHTEGLLALVLTLQGSPSPDWISRLARRGVELGCVTQDVIGSSPTPHGLPPGVSPGFAYPMLGSFTVLRDARGRWIDAQIFMANSGEQTGNTHVHVPAPRRPHDQIPSPPVCPPLSRLAADIR